MPLFIIVLFILFLSYTYTGWRLNLPANLSLVPNIILWTVLYIFMILPFFPGNFLARIDQPFISGLYKYKNMQVYVNRGTGYWGTPLRFGTNSEITEIILQA